MQVFLVEKLWPPLNLIITTMDTAMDTAMDKAMDTTMATKMDTWTQQWTWKTSISMEAKVSQGRHLNLFFFGQEKSC